MPAEVSKSAVGARDDAARITDDVGDGREAVGDHFGVLHIVAGGVDHAGDLGCWRNRATGVVRIAA